MLNQQMPPVFRFAPSPNGQLHLGHAYSALLNQKLARQAEGKLFLRIEDVDRQRSRPEFEHDIFEDLAWLGIKFDDVPRRQSDNLYRYQTALDKLIAEGFAYFSSISRSQIAELASSTPNWPRDPDGAFLPPTHERNTALVQSNAAIRLNMDAALAACLSPIDWQETGQRVHFNAGSWGDVVLKSRDGSFAYHLAVVIDDADQNITNIVRGRDLYAATAIHRLLQNILKLPQPHYQHHDLILDKTGEKLAKSSQSLTLNALRKDGVLPAELRAQLGFSA